MDETKDTRYLIAVYSGDKYYLVGDDIVYTEYINKAIRFSDQLSALLYIEKHGLEKLARIIKFPIENLY